MTSAANTTRLVAACVLVAAAAAVALLFLRDDASQSISARFLNAGQLVEGGRVSVAGRKVGSIEAVRLTDDGQARVEMSIDDESVLPLRRGTRAAIRAVGQAGLANRFVDLSPGPAAAPALDDGAELGTAQTSGIVNIDALLDSFGPRQRAGMRELIANSARVYAGSGSEYFNRMLGKLAPGLAELNGVTGDLARDRVALERLIDSAGRAAGAVASRREDLGSAVESSARALGAVADERRALAGTLTRAPAVLARARGTLARTGATVTALRPALREVPPAAAPLRGVLRRVSAVLPGAGRVVDELRTQLPDLRASLAGLRPLESPAVRALRSAGPAMGDATHIFRGFRFYGVDFVIGALAGIGGVAAGPYDALGHYGKVNFVQSPQTAFGGQASPLLSTRPLVPGLFHVRNGLDRRCPGGNVPPSPDGSSPWILDESICSPDHNTPASVNVP